VPRLPTASPSAQLCAVAALERWLEALGPDGPVLRTFHLRGRRTSSVRGGRGPGSCAGRAAEASVDGDFAGRLLRRGFVTNAAKKKIPIKGING